MSEPAGRNLPLSPPRRLICDLLHFAQKVPSVPVQRRMRLAEVVAAREAAQPRPSWPAVFAKAYGFVTAANPHLRQSYLGFPFPHLYEHPVNVAAVAIEREFGGESAVLFAPVRHPERLSLQEIDARLRHYKEAPVETVGCFRHALRLSRWPRPLRRLAWWFGLNVSGRKRAHYFGTFGLSVYASLGAASLHPLSVLTTTLNYGIIDDCGEVDVRLIYDHRVLDGATVARALADLERVLKQEILTELRYCQGLDAA